MNAAARSVRGAPRTLIGMLERVDIPAWGVRAMHARVDTGARTSAIHVEALEELGAGRVRFTLAPSRPGGRPSRWIEASIARRGRVRSTSGKIESRIFVTAKVVLGKAEHRIEIGVVDRRHMQNPMLLGRSALAGRYWVDPARRFLLTPSPDRQS